MRVHFGVLLAVICGVLSLSFGAAPATAAGLEPCKRAASGRACATLTVPLDRSGAVPGTVKLRVELQKAKRAVRPPLFLLPGGPGQSATRAFGREAVQRLFGTEGRSRDIVIVDMRGTGRSGALRCPALQRGATKEADVAACAARLGPGRDHYSSTDMAEDIDAVRAALGADRIALYGGSYGTYLAQVYARRYPARVERLVLDAVVGPVGVDPFERAAMVSVPEVVERLCGRGGCRGWSDPRGDAARLAAELDRRPLEGYVVGRDGRRRPARIDGRDLLDLMAASGTATGLVSNLIPGAIASAARGDAAPLLRTHAVWGGQEIVSSSRELNAASHVATLCTDTLLPWGGAVSPADRRSATAAFVAAQPATAFAPFGANTAIRSAVLDVCRAWPARPAVGASPAVGPLPDVPALLLAGGLDTRTPIDNARTVAAQMPQAKLMVVGHAGHGVLDSAGGGCPSSAVRRFLAGGEPGQCGPGPLVRAMPVYPRSLREIPLRGRARKAAGAVVFTIVDASVQTLGELVRQAQDTSPRTQLRLLGRPVRAGGLRGGRYSIDLEALLMSFDRSLAVPGVRVSGRLRMREGGYAGKLRVHGAAAARGWLAVRRSVLTGHLGGKAVRLPIHEIAGRLEGPTRSSATRAVLAANAQIAPWPIR
jgi:pimeloyl-ACP methyl ester carboxylesterase